MIQIKHIRSIAGLVWFVWLVLATGCAYQTPEEDWEKNGGVRLSLDWRSQTGYPAAMTWYFYKDGTGQPVVRRGDASGYEGTLPQGAYKVVVCNNDCENVLLETDNGYEQACGRARKASSLKSSTVSIVQPGNLYAAGCERINVSGEETAVAELTPTSLVKQLELNIKVTGPDADRVALKKLSGSLTGVSQGVYLSSGKPLVDMPASVAFEPEATTTGLYTTTLNLFSLPEQEADGNAVGLQLDMELADGRAVSTSTDITGEIGDAFAENTFSVILDLTVRYDGINSLSILLAEWKKGNEGSGDVNPRPATE